jgi:hypothetical protein
MVTSPGGGQSFTRSATGFVFKVGGVERMVKDSSGKLVADITTRTTEDLVVKGELKASRVVANGKLEIVNKVANYTVVVGPEDLTWTASCYCPTSGKLVGTITSAEKGEQTASIEFTGCGSGKITAGSQSAEVTFDRCTLF